MKACYRLKMIRRAAKTMTTYAPSTMALHADATGTFSHEWDVAAPIGVTSTFERVNDEAGYVYSRSSAPTRSRCETVLAALETQGGVEAQALLYSSGLAAVHGALCALMSETPGAKRRLLIDGGYHGTHAVIASLNSAHVQLDVCGLSEPQPGDIVWLESPKNPTAELADVAAYASTDVIVDATLGPPPLQYPLTFGARLVVHSATKALAGHSDAVAGLVLCAADDPLASVLTKQREAFGAVPGSLETWLLLRSLRTLDLRVKRQTATAAAIVDWLRAGVPGVKAVLSAHGTDLAARQMPKGVGGTFAIELDDEAMARAFPRTLKLFKDATSLGGCESLAEWRRRYDDNVSPTLIRISVGLEDPDDLIADIQAALDKLRRTT